LGLSTTIGRYQIFDIDGFYQNIRLKKTPAHFISADHSVDSTLFVSQHFAGLESVYQFRKTNSGIFPTKGIDFLLAAAYIQNLRESARSFANVASSLAFYIPLGRSFCLALRAGGATLSGDADVYHLNKLGGDLNLRGYDRERFLGKTTFYNNNELRWVTNTKNYFYNGKIGLFAFYDNGRVWQPLEKSDKWHFGYGGGLVLIPFNRAALTGSYATSEEGHFIQVKASVFF
jgi:outer membrane translocation and assembly module TamA